MHPAVRATEFRARCLSILDEVQQGKPAARLVPIQEKRGEVLFGRMKGAVEIVR